MTGDETRSQHRAVHAGADAPSTSVLTAARKFARQKFAQHRYAMVLHTHQKHPHVHLVVKAKNQLGRRLNIDKQLLGIGARTSRG